MSKNNLTNLSVTEALTGLNKKDFNAVELTEAHIDASQNAKDLNAYITETFEIALEKAKDSDARRGVGKAGALEGIPIAHKDMFCTKDVRTTAASKMLQNFIPPYESTVGQKLWDAGAIMLGKVSCDEFAMGGSNTTSHFGPVVNPWKSKSSPDKKLVPGGSSGGSSAIVAARGAMAATGTDTGGSIRQPAAFCGIVGMKPTYGRCSRWGIVAFASSLDQAGIFARTVEDTALLLENMMGHDPKDSTSANIAVPNLRQNLRAGVKGLKVGIPKEYRPNNLNAEIARQWDQGIDWLKQQGAEIVDVSLPHTKYALTTYYIIAPAEASSNLARYDGVRYTERVTGQNLEDLYELSRADGFGAEVKRRILIGTYVLSAGYYDAYYRKAQRIRNLIVQDFKTAFEKVDVLLTPTAPSAAFGIGENANDPVAMYLNDIFTIPASMAGLPGISVPTGLSDDGLPLGLQIIGKSFDEETVLRVAQAMEDAAQFKFKPL